MPTEVRLGPTAMPLTAQQLLTSEDRPAVPRSPSTRSGPGARSRPDLRLTTFTQAPSRALHLTYADRQFTYASLGAGKGAVLRGDHDSEICVTPGTHATGPAS